MELGKLKDGLELRKRRAEEERARIEEEEKLIEQLEQQRTLDDERQRKRQHEEQEEPPIALPYTGVVTGIAPSGDCAFVFSEHLGKCVIRERLLRRDCPPGQWVSFDVLKTDYAQQSGDQIINKLMPLNPPLLKTKSMGNGTTILVEAIVTFDKPPLGLQAVGYAEHLGKVLLNLGNNRLKGEAALQGADYTKPIKVRAGKIKPDDTFGCHWTAFEICSCSYKLASPCKTSRPRRQAGRSVASNPSDLDSTAVESETSEASITAGRKFTGVVLGVFQHGAHLWSPEIGRCFARPSSIRHDCPACTWVCLIIAADTCTKENEYLVDKYKPLANPLANTRMLATTTIGVQTDVVFEEHPRGRDVCFAYSSLLGATVKFDSRCRTRQALDNADFSKPVNIWAINVKPEEPHHCTWGCYSVVSCSYNDKQSSTSQPAKANISDDSVSISSKSLEPDKFDADSILVGVVALKLKPNLTFLWSLELGSVISDGVLSTTLNVGDWLRFRYIHLPFRPINKVNFCSIRAVEVISHVTPSPIPSRMAPNGKSVMLHVDVSLPDDPCAATVELGGFGIISLELVPHWKTRFLGRTVSAWITRLPPGKIDNCFWQLLRIEPLSDNVEDVGNSGAVANKAETVSRDGNDTPFLGDEDTVPESRDNASEYCASVFSELNAKDLSHESHQPTALDNELAESRAAGIRSTRNGSTATLLNNQKVQSFLLENERGIFDDLIQYFTGT